jgi:hypothetical protein
MVETWTQDMARIVAGVGKSSQCRHSFNLLLYKNQFIPRAGQQVFWHFITFEQTDPSLYKTKKWSIHQHSGHCIRDHFSIISESYSVACSPPKQQKAFTCLILKHKIYDYIDCCCKSVHHCHDIQAPTLRHCVNVSRTVIFIWEKKNDHMVNYNGREIKSSLLNKISSNHAAVWRCKTRTSTWKMQKIKSCITIS